MYVFETLTRFDPHQNKSQGSKFLGIGKKATYGCNNTIKITQPVVDFIYVAHNKCRQMNKCPRRKKLKV